MNRGQTDMNGLEKRLDVAGKQKRETQVPKQAERTVSPCAIGNSPKRANRAKCFES